MRFACVLFLVIMGLEAQAPQPDGGGVRGGTLPRSWVTGGPDCTSVPEWQIHAYNEDFYILRESGCTNYEKPFLYQDVYKRQQKYDAASRYPSRGPYR